MEHVRACKDIRACFARVCAPRESTVVTASTNAHAKMVLCVITCQAPAPARKDSRVGAAKRRATRAGLA